MEKCWEKAEKLGMNSTSSLLKHTLKPLYNEKGIGIQIDKQNRIKIP